MIDHQQLADIYKKSFPGGRPWEATEFGEFTNKPNFIITSDAGFVIGRVIGDEAELITIAIDPEFQGRGRGRMLLNDFETRSTELGAAQLFLEVAADNEAAIALYETANWQRIGKRPDYYRRSNQPSIDALIYQKFTIPYGQT